MKKRNVDRIVEAAGEVGELYNDISHRKRDMSHTYHMCRVSMHICAYQPKKQRNHHSMYTIPLSLSRVRNNIDCYHIIQIHQHVSTFTLIIKSVFSLNQTDCAVCNYHLLWCSIKKITFSSNIFKSVCTYHSLF